MEEAFQRGRLGLIKSLIWREGKFQLEGNFGLGLKEGMEGTQFEDQIEEDDVLETFR